MFGGELTPPKCIRRQRPHPAAPDIQLPSVQPGYYQHVGRDPNTNQHVQMLHYRQRKNAEELRKSQNESRRLLHESIDIEYDRHVEEANFKRQIKERVQRKLAEYDKSIEHRRERLKALLCDDECEIHYALLEKERKGDTEKFLEMRIKTEQLKAKREAERLKLVEQKRIEQYKNRMWEIRSEWARQNLIESKNCQLQQMRENEIRREAEREIEKMWCDVQHKEMEQLIEREKQELLNQRRLQQNLKETWAQQVQGKVILQEEKQRITKEDQMELDKLREELNNEERYKLQQKQNQINSRAKELQDQIAEQERFLKQRRDEEEALDKAMVYLTEQELKKEEEKKQKSTIQKKRENNLYKTYHNEMKMQKRQEEKHFDEILEINRKDIERKAEDARCKLIEAKQKLLKSVLEGRAEQLKHKQEEAEQQLKLKESENEVVRMAWEANRRLQEEQERMAMEAAKQYRQDLQKQIEFNRELQRREQERLDRQLAEGLKEEERYRKIMQDLLNGDYEMKKHPFRVVLDQSDCKCPP